MLKMISDQKWWSESAILEVGNLKTEKTVGYGKNVVFKNKKET